MKNYSFDFILASGYELLSESETTINISESQSFTVGHVLFSKGNDVILINFKNGILTEIIHDVYEF